MKKVSTLFGNFHSTGILILGWMVILMAAYGRLLIHPDLHTACPENDTWNLPIRWSVLSALRDGRVPLWNSLSAFGIPWLATWQTETFYPGTQFFKWIGLSFWNYSGILHLLIFSLGIYRFLRLSKVQLFWAFFSSAIALLNGCAYSHLGSNSSMDTMAWVPWIFVSVREILTQKKFGGIKLALFLTLQIFAGYPQIIFYTLAGAFAYMTFVKGGRSLSLLVLPVGCGLLLSACQWIPSVEYFFFNKVRLPAVHDNPHFFLPWENLKTFWDFNALAKDGAPDYVASPTFFYFNFYSGLIPLVILTLGVARFNKLNPSSRFFLSGFFLLTLWALGVFGKGFELIHLPFPGFLEPAKSWVLIDLFELFAVGFLMEDLFPKPKKWKWVVLTAAILNLLIPVWNHPLERNLLPPNPQLDAEAQKIKSQLGSGRLLVLPNAHEHAALYTPLPDPEKRPLFKRFIPNSNYFASLPVATFYGSTQPAWGAWDAGFYFQYGFPYDKGTLMDLLGVDVLLIPESRMPPRFKKISTNGAWTLWKNPTSLGSNFIFTGNQISGSRKEAFEAFASGAAQPLRNLYLNPQPISLASRHLSDFSRPPSPMTLFPRGAKGHWVVTQNAMPGWRAWVDGSPVDIYLADGIFQCVPIPPNTGWVKLLYEPASFRFGLFVSLLALMGFGLVKGFRELFLFAKV